MRESAIAFSIAAILSLPLTAQSGPRLYVSADMEGVVGAVTSEQLGPAGFEYQRFREFMTGEVLAAIDAARAAGASVPVVSDSHGNGQNLLIERLPDDVAVIRSWPRPLTMMEGIDAGFDGVIFLGYHASTSNTEGVRAHTFSSANLAGVRLNGVDMSEASWNAAIAGHFGVPVIMISGDDAIVAEARKLLGPIEAATVKEAISFHSARTLTPAAAYREIAAAVDRAVARLAEFQPYRVELPASVELQFKNYRPAEVLALLPSMTRVDSHTVRFSADDMLEASRIVHFALNYAPDLAP